MNPLPARLEALKEEFLQIRSELRATLSNLEAKEFDAKYSYKSVGKALGENDNILQQLGSFIETVKADTKDLRVARSQIGRRLDPPISVDLLPNEILLEIFRLCLEGLEDPRLDPQRGNRDIISLSRSMRHRRLALSSVYSRWRGLILGCGPLWSRIAIHGSWKTYVPNNSEDSYHIIPPIPQLELELQRSKTSPMILYAFHTINLTTTETDVSEQWSPYLSLIIPYVSACKTLGLHLQQSAIEQIVAKFTLPIPHLTTLKIRTFMSSHRVNFNLSNTRQLSYLSLDGRVGPPPFSNCDTVTVLELGSRMPLHTGASLTAACSGLVFLHWSRVDPISELSPSPEIINLPNLQHLVLGGMTSSDTLCGSGVRINAPQLRILSTRHCDDFSHYKNLEDLHLEFEWMHGLLPASYINNLTSVVTISFPLAWDGSSEMITALAGKGDDVGSGTIVLPNLKRVVVDAISDAAREFEPELVQLMEARGDSLSIAFDSFGELWSTRTTRKFPGRAVVMSDDERWAYLNRAKPSPNLLPSP